MRELLPLKILLIFTIFFLIYPFSSKAINYYIKTNGDNTSGGTFWTNAWETIGYAASNVSTGDVVIISNGIYRENISIISNSNITFISWGWINSQDNTSTILYGSGAFAQEIFALKNSRRIVIQGFSLNGQDLVSPWGITIENNSSSNLIANNKIFSNHDFGIEIRDNSKFNCIKSNKIFDQMGVGQRIGIAIRGNYNLISHNNIARNSNSGYSHNGISLSTSASNNIIKFNQIYSNYSGIT
ncbi:MAG: right-handed parallel beta-helix repeat-containing protein, partial [Spirochaetes bacterium]|nr:right-handed parallel beta-helix repeat-containing protein [Spirochaetota bacterium]